MPKEVMKLLNKELVNSLFFSSINNCYSYILMMKKDLFKIIVVILLLTFSFYYARKISTLIIYKSSLMKEILDNKDKYETESVNAIINGDYITPGIDGYEVLGLESYYQMKKDNVFDEDKIVYEEVEPEVSIGNNQTLIINRANSYKRKVSIIINDNPEVEDYIIKNRIKASKLVTLDTYKKKSVFEQINYDKDYNKLEKKLKEYEIDNNICVLNNYNKEDCLNNHKYLIKPTYTISDSSLIKSTINSGDIIMIDDSLTLSSFKILLQKINYQNLSIDTVTNLISEKR